MSDDPGRRRILERLRDAARALPAAGHPGPAPPLTAADAENPDRADAENPDRADAATIDRFAAAFTAAGGEVVVLDDAGSAAAWLERFAHAFHSAAVGTLVPASLRPRLSHAPAAAADLGVSLARAAAADTGSLLLDGRDGRAAQLLPPVHLVWLPAPDIRPTLAAALRAVPLEAPAAFALHSGPSKSADIGGILVRGVHGPGRVVAAVLSYAIASQVRV